MQPNFNVDYELNGERKTEESVSASDPGRAMARVLKDIPTAKIIRAWKEGTKFGGGSQEWFAPPVQRAPQPEPKPAGPLKPKERGCEFPFYDQCLSVKR